MNLQSQDIAQLLQSNQKTVFKIGAKWCKSCHNKKFLDSYEKIKESNPEVKFISLDLDEDFDLLNDKTYYNFEIDQLPYFIVKTECDMVNFMGINSLDEINENLK